MPLFRTLHDARAALGVASGARDPDLPREVDGAVAVALIGGSRSERQAAAAALVAARTVREPHTRVWLDPDPWAWPFRRHVAGGLPAGPLVVVAEDVHHAFENRQTGGTRLALTQSTYVMQRWIDALAPRHATLVTMDDEPALRRVAPEAFAARGPWASVVRLRLPGARPMDREADDPDADRGAVLDDAPAEAADARPHGPATAVQGLLRAAFTSASLDERLELCQRIAAAHVRSPVAWLALASAEMERQDFDRARDALDRAERLAPDWEAVHFERGKLRLRLDDMDAAARAFGRANTLMPSFSAASSNLGATLGELDRPEAGLAAFRQAIAHDPFSYTVLNNIGVVTRELGRLDESETALRRVLELAPGYVFGHYNLGHTLFLQGRFAEARTAYEEGQRRDPERNARQAARLAYARLAAGDPAGALRDLAWAIEATPPENQADLLAEADEVVGALRAHRPDLEGGRGVVELIRRAMSSLEKGTL